MLMSDHEPAPPSSPISHAYAVARAHLANRQQPGQQVSMPKAGSHGSEQQTAVPQPGGSQHPSLQRQQSTALQIQQPGHERHQHMTRQQSGVAVPKEVEDLAGECQPPQVLRRRPKSRLGLTQGGVVKGILSLAKQRSGRVSPEKAALLPFGQGSGASHQYHDDDDDDDDDEVAQSSGMEDSVSGRHCKLKTVGLVAMTPNSSRLAVRVPAAARPAAKPCLSIKEMLSSSLQQVQACTEQLQLQHAQQQQLHRAIKAMTAKTVAMLDQAILAAVNAQEHADVLERHS